jgi:hypothetical protein
MGMDANKHTTLPYRTTNIRGEVRDQHGFIVADCQKQEDAEFIVRACNSFDVMVEALTKIADGQVMSHDSPFTHLDTVIAYQGLARAALDLARATQSNHVE